MSHLDQLREAGVFDWIDQQVAAIPSQGKSTCQHCGKPIVFKPFYLDGKLPNPPVWGHEPRHITTCDTRPADWPRNDWPHSAPVEEPGPPILWETMAFGGPADMYQDRYASREAAIQGHEEMVQRVKDELAAEGTEVIAVDTFAAGADDVHGIELAVRDVTG